MLTLVLQCGHVNCRENMATTEYRRGHGTLTLGKLIGPTGPCQSGSQFQLAFRRAT